MDPKGMKMGRRRTHSLYHSHNLVRVIKSRILKWAEHVARIEGASPYDF